MQQQLLMMMLLLVVKMVCRGGGGSPELCMCSNGELEAPPTRRGQPASERDRGGPTPARVARPPDIIGKASAPSGAPDVSLIRG